MQSADQARVNAAIAATPGALLINELFETVQGEATFTGSPAVFIRLQGCPVACPWCDTKGSWSIEDENEIPPTLMGEKVKDAPTFARMGAIELAKQVLGTTRARHIVITGGEPALYDLRPISEIFIEAGRTVQLETSGTSEIRIDPRAFVTVSPKVGMPGGLKVRDDALLRADEIKMPVGKPADVERLRAVIGQLMAAKGVRAGGVPTVWLQPLSQSEKATALCVEAATTHGWRISVQTHKYLGVR
jgi:7-carboxy-7-deazaguanine synthase